MFHVQRVSHVNIVVLSDINVVSRECFAMQ
jgi:hypothetical protein